MCLLTYATHVLNLRANYAELPTYADLNAVWWPIPITILSCRAGD